MTEREKMLAGQLYNALDKELVAGRQRARTLTQKYNCTTEEQQEERASLLQQLLGSVGNGVFVEPPFRCDYGSQIYVGDYFYANFDCIILDVCSVTIGHHCLLGPRVGIYTATHPALAAQRISGLEFGKPIIIGNHVWIGGNALIMPGVTIGNDVVVAAGAVVTKDVPDGTMVAGNPAKVIRCWEALEHTK